MQNRLNDQCRLSIFLAALGRVAIRLPRRKKLPRGRAKITQSRWRRDLQRQLGRHGTECRRFRRSRWRAPGRCAGRTGRSEAERRSARISTAPVRFVIDSHWHFDHVGGNAFFAKEGAFVIAQSNTRMRLMAEQANPLGGAKQHAFPTGGLAANYLRCADRSAFQWG